jgi:hypothetical protein
MQVRIGHKKISTHIDGQTRIDFAFATPRVVEACIHAGYEPFWHRFEMDHRGFFLDLDNEVLFGNQTAILQSPSQRGLTSKSFKHRKTYIAYRWKYLNHHKWFERLWAALQREEVPPTRQRLDCFHFSCRKEVLELPCRTLFPRNSKASMEKDNF